MDWIADIRLTDGPLYWTAWVLGAAATAYLIWRPRPLGLRRWLLSAAAALVAAAGLVLLVHWILIYITPVFPDDLPFTVLAWVFAAVAALMLMLLRIPTGSWRRRERSA